MPSCGDVTPASLSTIHEYKQVLVEKERILAALAELPEGISRMELGVYAEGEREKDVIYSAARYVYSNFMLRNSFPGGTASTNTVRRKRRKSQD